jgi:prophage tail gpP-like protein
MSKATPGKTYTVQVGDTYSSIAQQAYGDGSFSYRIIGANQSNIELSPGQTIIIPVLTEDSVLKTELAKAKLKDKSKDDLTIIINGKEIKPLSSNIIRTMDTVSDGWTAYIDWVPGADKTIDEIYRPFAYHPASVYIGGDLIINGVLYATEPEFSNDGRKQNLEGFSFTADLVDSTLKPPYEYNNMSLEQLAPELVKPVGINAEFNVDTGGPFDRITANDKDTIAGVLIKYAKQRGCLVTSKYNGDLLITKATAGRSLGTLEEGKSLDASKIKYDGRKLFNVYRATGQSPFGFGSSKVFISKDDNVPRSRFKTIQVNDTTDGNIQKAADWERSKQLAEALSFPIEYDSWLAPNGSLWRENTLITIVSKTFSLSKGFTFLIKSVTYIYDNEGRRAILTLVPPQVYSGLQIPNIWG